MIKAIIFDLDGTLVNSLKDITKGVNYALDLTDGDQLSTFEVSKMIGNGAPALIREAIRKAGLEHCRTDKDCIDKYLLYYAEHAVDYAKPYPGVVDLLSSLDMKKAVVTNKIESMARKVLVALDLLKYFDIIVGSDTTCAQKPSSVPYRRAMKNMGVVPEETIVVGDSEIDIRPAKLIPGLRCVACIWGYGKPGFQWNADYTIDDISKLIPIVKEKV